MTPDCHLFAWRGFQMEVPREWEINFVQGSEEKGELHLDDGEMACLELDWARARTEEPFEKITNRFLAALRKQRNVGQEIRRGDFQVKIPEAEAETFSWTGGVDVVGMVVRCLQCKRVSLVRLIGKRGEGLKSTAARVLSSFRDHGSEGRVPWSVLGFRFEVPEAYLLSRYSMQVGRLEFEFKSGKTIAQALRVSLAQTILSKQSVLEWFGKDPIGKFERAKPRVREAPHHLHPGVEADGREGGFLRMLGEPTVIHCRAWHCTESNNLLAARWIGRLSAEREFDLFSNSFKCH